MRWAVHVARMGRCIYTFGWETRGNEATWKTRLGWENNIKMILQKMEWRGMDWIDLTEGRKRCQAL